MITTRKLAPHQRTVRTLKTFDEVLGTRDVRNTALAREVRVLNQDDISLDESRDNLILFRIYFTQGRERCSELQERYSEVKFVRKKAFAKPVPVFNLHKNLWSNFLK